MFVCMAPLQSQLLESATLGHLEVLALDLADSPAKLVSDEALGLCRPRERFERPLNFRRSMSAPEMCKPQGEWYSGWVVVVTTIGQRSPGRVDLPLTFAGSQQRTQHKVVSGTRELVWLSRPLGRESKTPMIFL